MCWTRAALVLLLSCGNRDREAPAERNTATAPSAFRFRFALAPTNAPQEMFSPGVEIEYAFRRHGNCDQSNATGEAFVPHKGGEAALESLGNHTVSILLADVDAVTIGMVVRGDQGNLIASGCVHAKLAAAQITPVEIPLTRSGS
jgi:hypothetical protein